jgi:hypothetical protein
MGMQVNPTGLIGMWEFTSIGEQKATFREARLLGTWPQPRYNLGQSLPEVSLFDTLGNQ